MFTREQPNEILKAMLQNVFGLPETNVSEFVDNLTQSHTVELAAQKLQAMPTEKFEALIQQISNASGDDSVDGTELGDPDLEQMSQFYSDNVDFKGDTDKPHEAPRSEFEETERGERNMQSLMQRLLGQCGCTTESGLIAFGQMLSELNQADAEALISSDVDDQMDPAIKQRITRLMASGNKLGADQLRKREMRKIQMANNKNPKTPMDNLVANKKRELAMAIQRKQQMSGGATNER